MKRALAAACAFAALAAGSLAGSVPAPAAPLEVVGSGGTTGSTHGTTGGGAVPVAAHLAVLSFPRTTKGLHGPTGSPPAHQKPGDPDCQFVTTRGRIFPKYSHVAYPQVASDMPQVIQEQPEAANGAFRPAPAVVVARDKAVFAAMNQELHGKVVADIARSPAEATYYIFATTADLGPDVLAGTRLAYDPAVPSKALFSWSAYTLGDLAADSYVEPHEEGHGRYGLGDNPQDSFYDLAGAVVGDTAGLSDLWSAKPLQLDRLDRPLPVVRLGACDVKTIMLMRVWVPGPARLGHLARRG